MTIALIADGIGIGHLWRLSKIQLSLIFAWVIYVPTLQMKEQWLPEGAASRLVEVYDLTMLI